MNFIDILELPSQYNIADIKKSYKKLVKQYHPDINEHSSEDKIKQINLAYEIAIKSLKYIPNKDIHMNIEIPLEKIFSGCVEEVEYNIGKNRKLTLNVNIPKSTQYNTTFIFRNKGFDDNKSLPEGDVYIKIVEPKNNKNVSINSYDIVIKHAITHLDILIGNVHNIKNIDGKTLNVNINKFDITQTLKIENRGLYKPDNTRGNLYINFYMEEIKLSKEEKQALEYIRKRII